MTPRIFPITSGAGMEGGPRSKTLVQVIRRTIAVMAVPALLSPALIVASPATASTRTACSKAYFFGAHGVNEGSSGAKPGKAHWGTPVDAVWNALVSKLKPNAPTGISANYPRSVIDLPKWLGGPGLPKGPSPWATLLNQLLSLSSATNTGASALAGQMWNTYLSCPDSSFVLAGYSQGAWAIDKALRTLSDDGPVGKAVLADTKGVFLMGDPAWANSNPNQWGVASSHHEGYKSEAAYLANGLPQSNFFSVCAGPDPVCNWAGIGGLSKNIGVHIHAYTAGKPSAAVDGGIWLASRLSPPPSSCAPKINAVGPFQATGTQRVVITGSCFGTGNLTSGSDSPYFRISDLTAGWNACWTGDPNGDQVTCRISSWTNQSITFSGFTGAYGQNGWAITRGDRIEVQVWNPQSGKGAATYTVVAGG